MVEANQAAPSAPSPAMAVASALIHGPDDARAEAKPGTGCLNRPPPHTHDVRVYYEDTDAGGIVYHATYLRWAERARTEALRALGLPHALMAQQHGAALVVKRIEVEYSKPARLDDLVTIRTTIRRVSAVLDLDQDVLLGDEVLAALKVRLVCIGGPGGDPGSTPRGGPMGENTMRPRPVPEPWRSALRACIATPENTA